MSTDPKTFEKKYIQTGPNLIFTSCGTHASAISPEIYFCSRYTQIEMN